jgi:hypothetical protein
MATTSSLSPGGAGIVSRAGAGSSFAAGVRSLSTDAGGVFSTGGGLADSFWQALREKQIAKRIMMAVQNRIEGLMQSARLRRRVERAVLPLE